MNNRIRIKYDFHINIHLDCSLHNMVQKVFQQRSRLD